MKWIKFADELDSNMKNAKNIFQTIPPIYNGGKKVGPKAFSKNTSAMLKNQLGIKFVQWVTYPKPGKPALPDLDIKGRRKYELFCGGFLYYHDIIFKKYPSGKGYTVDKNGNPAWKEYPKTAVGPNGKVYPGKKFEHMIFFEWLPKGKGVRIYINETPSGFNTNPPKPPGPPPPES